jgi:hypothetical protein
MGANGLPKDPNSLIVEDKFAGISLINFDSSGSKDRNPLAAF